MTSTNVRILIESSRTRILNNCQPRVAAVVSPSLAQGVTARRLETKRSHVKYCYGHLQRYPLASRFFSASASSSHDNFISTSDGSTSIVNDDEANKSTKAKKSTITAEYASLAKARLSALVVSTTLAGYVASSGGDTFSITSLPVLCSVLAGTSLCSSSAAGWNQIIEVNRDKLMKRTQQRPLVKKDGLISTNHAKIVSTLWGVSGIGLLAIGTDPITTALGASNIILYSGVYTFMKPLSIYNTWVGAVVGAIPPVMGFTAAAAATTNGLGYYDILFDQNVAYLGSILFCWQMPHFFALGVMYRTDYRRGGFKMLPVVEYDQQQEFVRQQHEQGFQPAVNPLPFEKTANVMLRYTKYMSLIPFITTLSGQTNVMFAIEGIAINGYLYYVTNNFYKDRTNAKARKVFLTSLWYLPSFLALYLLHSKVWDGNDDKESYDDKLSGYIHAIRNVGKQLCIHETALVNNGATNGDILSNTSSGGNKPKENSAAALCPLVLAKRKSLEIEECSEAVAKSVTNKATIAVTP